MMARLAMWLYISLGVTPIAAFLLQPGEDGRKENVSFSQTRVGSTVCTAHLLAGVE
jgi:hypothetical protein